MEDKVLSAADHTALEHLVIELAWRLDHGQRHLLHELFVEDGEVVHFKMSESGPLYIHDDRGREALVSLGQVPHPTRALHAVTNLRFEADGPDRATGSGILMVFYDADRQYVGTSVPRIVGDYAFNCTRANEGWLFAKVQCTQLFGHLD